MGKLCQIEFLVSDVERSLQFYQEVFGWREVPIDIHDYKIVDTGTDSPYGIAFVKAPAKGPSNQRILLHFSSSESAAIIERAGRLGAPCRERKLPGYGKLHLVTDPDGIQVGVFEADGDLVSRA